MNFGGIQKTSTIDFPGVLSCVVFTRGCNLDCFYCHNRELISGGGSLIDEEKILTFLEKRKGLLDGIVVSGGEPLLQPDLPEFLQKVRRLGYKIKLDTNGQMPEKVLELLKQGLLDYIAIDIKALPEDYPSVCGHDGFENVRLLINNLLNINAAFEVRTTLYPGMTFEQLTELLRLLPEMPLWRINYFHMPQVFRGNDEQRLHGSCMTKQQLEKRKDALISLQKNILID